MKNVFLIGVVVFGLVGLCLPGNDNTTTETNTDEQTVTEHWKIGGYEGTTKFIRIFHQITPIPKSKNGELVNIGDNVGIALIDKDSPEDNGYYVIRDRFGDDGVFKIVGYTKMESEMTNNDLMPLVSLPNGKIVKIDVPINSLTITHTPIDRLKWEDYKWLGNLHKHYYFKIEN